MAGQGVNSKRTTIVLGAGASRAVSYGNPGGVPSPLDSDFFDLLQRLEVADKDAAAVAEVLKLVGTLPAEYRRSMERAFYTLHLRRRLIVLLDGDGDGDRETSVEQLLSDFARAIQALLRRAHGKNSCRMHRWLFRVLSAGDAIVSFNYDLVVERAIRALAKRQGFPLSSELYGLSGKKNPSFPVILKLHGSSNWRVLNNGKFELRAEGWTTLDGSPGYRGFLNVGEAFPILLPFWDKKVEDGPWLTLWKRAYAQLVETEALLVWGYSLPATDLKALQLVNLALAQRKDLSLCIIDPSAATRQRWRDALPNAKYWEYESFERFKKHPPAWWEAFETD